MAIGKKKIIPMLKEFPKYEIIDELEENIKKEMSFFTPLETDSDPIQMKRNTKKWKQTISYFLLHHEEFKFGLRDLK